MYHIQRINNQVYLPFKQKYCVLEKEMGQSLKFLGNINLNLELFIQPNYESNVRVGRDWFVPMLHGVRYWNYHLLPWLGKLAVSTKGIV